MSRFTDSVIVIGNFLIPLVNCYHHWKSLTQKFSTSELLITSESVEYRTILSNMEEKTPTISPDQGATGETASSTKNMDVGMQTSLSEKERETQYRKHYAEGIFKLLELFERLHGKGYDEVIKNKEELLDQVLDFVLLLLQYAKLLMRRKDTN